MKRRTWYRQAFRNLGPISLMHLQMQKRFGSRRKDLRLRSRWSQHPVYARRGSSDLKVFNQIFVAREYRCLDGLKEPGLIIDCGANVGYSSAYFLSMFPRSFVIAVEPDPDNFAMLERNLWPYKGRYTAIRAAVWPRAEKLQFKQSSIGLGREWERVVERDDGTRAHQVQAVDIPELLAQSRFERVSLLKIDIEGAETELFNDPPLPWLDLVDNITIELHGDTAKESFFAAITGRRYDVSVCDELTVCLAK